MSDFIFLPPSFYFLLSFCSYESTKDKLSLYHIWTLVRRFAGAFCKSFLPPHYNWKVTSRLLGYFTKILQKNCREIFPTTAHKKEVRYYSNFLLHLILNCVENARCIYLYFKKIISLPHNRTFQS